MAADPVIYCLEQLTDYSQFERFCSDLMVLEGFDGLEPLGGFKDKGRDAVHTSKNSGQTAIFAYSVREDWLKKLNEDATKIKRHGHLCDELIFLTTAELSATSRDNAIRDISKKYKFSLQILGQERLRSLLLNKHSELIGRHPQIFTPAFFQGTSNEPALKKEMIVVDFIDEDETLANWISKKLMLEGHRVWCKGISPIAGASLQDTIENLTNSNAFRLLQVLSPKAALDQDLTTRRIFALAVNSKLVLPIVACNFDINLLDSKSKALETIDFSNSWASGLEKLTSYLRNVNCPTFQNDHSHLPARLVLPIKYVVDEPERILSNRFAITEIPSSISRFVSEKPIDNSEWDEAVCQWAFKRINSTRFLSFFEPPATLRTKYGISNRGGSAWRLVEKVDEVHVRVLLPELIKKSLMVHSIAKGLKYSQSQRSLYFPEDMTEKLKFTKADGRKGSVVPTGKRNVWRPGNIKIPYKYQLAPQFSVVQVNGDYRIETKIKIRFTDDANRPLAPRVAFARRKHLCTSWYNPDWLNKMLAVMNYLSENDRISISQGAINLAISATPDEWLAPIRINEDAIDENALDREQYLSFLIGDEDEDEELLAHE